MSTIHRIAVIMTKKAIFIFNCILETYEFLEFISCDLCGFSKIKIIISTKSQNPIITDIFDVGIFWILKRLNLILGWNKNVSHAGEHVLIALRL